METTLTYEEYLQKSAQLFQEGKFQEVFDLSTRHLADFPGSQPMLQYYRMCAAARLEQYELVEKILADTLEEGSWFAEAIFRQSPSLLPMAGRPRYEALSARSIELSKANQDDHPLPIFSIPDHAAAYPLVYALHSNGSSAEAASGHWHWFAEAGWLVALPRSGQGLYKGAYNWPAYDQALPVLLEQYQHTLEQHTIDTGRVILAGHSMGGQHAMRLALSGAIPALGFIVIGPYLPEEVLEEWEKLLPDIKNREMKGVIFLGENDHSISHDTLKRLKERMEAMGMAVWMEALPGEGHDFSQAFKDRLPAALQFIL